MLQNFPDVFASFLDSLPFKTYISKCHPCLKPCNALSDHSVRSKTSYISLWGHTGSSQSSLPPIPLNLIFCYSSYPAATTRTPCRILKHAKHALPSNYWHSTRLDSSSEPDFPVIPQLKISYKSKQNYSTHTLFNIKNIPFVPTFPILSQFSFTFNYFAFIKFNKQISQLK